MPHEPDLTTPISETLADGIKPTIGRIVTYRSRTGDWVAPAIISATVDTLYRPNVEAGHLPDLTGPTHVHLTVFTPGTPGRGKALAEVQAAARPETPIAGAASGGTFQEHDVPFGPGAGSWTWPERS